MSAAAGAPEPLVPAPAGGAAGAGLGPTGHGAETGKAGSAAVGPTHRADQPAVTEHTALSTPRLGVASLVFLIIAASAPLTVLAGGAPTSYGVTGVLGLPLGYLALGVLLSLFAVGYGAMSASIRNAGAFYAYIAAGLGVRQGIAASLLALVSYNAMQVGLYGIFGFTVAVFLQGLIGVAVPWWGCALAAWLLVGLLGIGRVDLSAKVIAVLVVLEFLTVAAIDVLSLVVAPEGVSTVPLQPSSLFVPGIGAMLAFGVAAFMGFESGAVYAEETREPRRSVPTATFIAVGLIACFYAFSSWTLAVGIGPSAVVARSAELGPDLVFVMLGDHTAKIVVDVVNLLFITSLLAALMAFHNAAARYFYALGRTGVLPRLFGRTLPASGAPLVGSLAQSGLALIVVVVFAVVGRNAPEGPLFPVVTLFSWLTNAAAFGLVFLLTVTSLAVIGFFRSRPEEVGIFTRLIAPMLAAIGLGTVFVLILINFDVLIGSGSPVLVTVMPGIILAAGVIGLIRGEYLRRVRPEVYREAAEQLDTPV